MSSIYPCFLVSGGLITTALYFTSIKNVYECWSWDAHGVHRPAEIPLFMIFLDFLMNALMLPLAPSTPSKSGPPHSAAAQDRKIGPPPSTNTLWEATLVILPMIVLMILNDIVDKTAVTMISALLFTTLRTFRILCAAMLHYFCMGQRISNAQWAALLAIAFSTCCASYHSTGSHDSSTFNGVLMTLLSCLLNTWRCVLEEIAIKAKRIGPEMCAGLQGAYVTVLSVVVLFVATAVGYENLWDSLALIRNSYALQAMILFFCAVSLADCWFMIKLVAELDTCTKTMTATCSIYLVWAAQMVIYKLTAGQHGEMLSPSNNICFLLALCICVLSVWVYVRYKTDCEPLLKDNDVEVQAATPSHGSASASQVEDVRCKGAKAIKVPLAGKKIDLIYECARDVAKLADDNGIQLLLMAGSALGLARNGGIIPGDDDIDFYMHAEDKDAWWALRDRLKSCGWSMVHADLGFKIGSGPLRKEVMGIVDGTWTSLGCEDPYPDFNIDIFTISFQGEYAEDGDRVLRYTSARIRAQWPDWPALPESAWNNPVRREFGGFFDGLALDDYWLRWYLQHGYGPTCMTHDEEGIPISDFSHLKHSSLF